MFTVIVRDSPDKLKRARVFVLQSHHAMNYYDVGDKYAYTYFDGASEKKKKRYKQYNTGVRVSARNPLFWESVLFWNHRSSDIQAIAKDIKEMLPIDELKINLSIKKQSKTFLDNLAI